MKNIQPLASTEERMVPDTADPAIFIEHLMRYRFAAAFVKGQDVLDIACGEGYGASAMMRRGAKSVLGIDISEEAVSHAIQRYGVPARVGSAMKIPVDASSVDVVVSFETIEHVAEPDVFLDECFRVLRPGGRLVVSTPNRPVYRRNTPSNEFHCSEMSVEEFRQKLSKNFDCVELFGQVVPAPRYLLGKAFGRILRGIRRLLYADTCGAISDRTRTKADVIASRPVTAIEILLNPRSVQRVPDVILNESLYTVATALAKS